MKEKTADEMFEELGYKKKNLDIIFSRFWEEWENEDLAKTFSFNTEYKTIDITDENRYGITMQELQVINKKVEELGVDIMMTPGNIDKLQKECDFEYMKEKIEEQETKLRELTEKNNVVDLDYKEEYYKLQKENYKLKQQMEEHQEALLKLCLNLQEVIK